MLFACSFGLQIAKASGASVICITSSDEKGKVAKSLGADFVINYKENPDWDKEALEIVRYGHRDLHRRPTKLIV